jgi:hypothetical protein
MFNNKEQFSKKIYVSIDTLLDLRLGTLIQISPDFAAILTSKKNYYTRKNDVFQIGDSKLQKEIFDNLYNKKLNEIYKKSPCTKIHLFLLDLIKALSNLCSNLSINVSDEIDLNFYPINISKKEQIIICKILEEKLFNSIKVNPIYIELNNLTPELVLEDYSCLVMYNYVEWINSEKNKKSIANKKLKDIMLYCPMLYNTEDIPIEEIKKLTNKNLDPFDLQQGLVSSFIKIIYIPICVFCIDNELNLDEYKNVSN